MKTIHSLAPLYFKIALTGRIQKFIPHVGAIIIASSLDNLVLSTGLIM